VSSNYTQISKKFKGCKGKLMKKERETLLLRRVRMTLDSFLKKDSKPILKSSHQGIRARMFTSRALESLKMLIISKLAQWCTAKIKISVKSTKDSSRFSPSYTTMLVMVDLSLEQNSISQSHHKIRFHYQEREFLFS
jgi:hypothetical protein